MKNNLKYSQSPSGFWVKQKELELAKDKADAKEVYSCLITGCIVFVILFVGICLLKWDFFNVNQIN